MFGSVVHMLTNEHLVHIHIEFLVMNTKFFVNVVRIVVITVFQIMKTNLKKKANDESSGDDFETPFTGSYDFDNQV